MEQLFEALEPHMGALVKIKLFASDCAIRCEQFYFDERTHVRLERLKQLLHRPGPRNSNTPAFLLQKGCPSGESGENPARAHRFHTRCSWEPADPGVSIKDQKVLAQHTARLP